MVYNTLSLVFFIFIIYFFDFLCKNLSYTYYFSYISSLNYLDTNILYLLILFFFFFLTNSRWLFFFFKFFFISTSFNQVFFIKTLLSSLIIGTVLIHPIMFYVCLIIFLIKFYYNRDFINFNYFRISNSNLIVFLTITMFLGGFWATQSSAWGYFWVNDLVEWILLFIILSLILCLHYWFLSSSTYNFFILEFFILNVLILIRVGFLSTRHNFILFGLSIYIIFYLYVLFFFKVFSIRFYISNHYKYQRLVILFWFFLAQCLYLLLKFFFFIYFCVFYKKMLKYIKLNYFHYVFFFFIFSWLSPFVFFKVLNVNWLHLGVMSNSLFNAIYVNMFLIFYENSFHELLNVVNFIFSYFKYYYAVNFHTHLFLLLNNYQLIYILILLLFVFRKIGWT